MAEEWMQSVVRQEIQAGIDLHERLLDHSLLQRVVTVGEVVTRAYTSGGKILAFGNGGSAADAQHVAAEFVGRFRRERRPLAAVALSTDVASITAIGNDYAFEEVFTRQVEAHGNAGDVAIAFSTSGASENVIRGVETARAMGLTTVGLSGERGRLKDVAEHAICVPARDTARIQEAHMLICHIVCELVERALFA